MIHKDNLILMADHLTNAVALSVKEEIKQSTNNKSYDNRCCKFNIILDIRESVCYVKMVM